MWKMRTLCDVCEAAPAQLFCAADEAALCIKCDEKVHGCNKLANRHVRLQLGEARAVPKCDICESAPAFFFCGIDGTSLCLQCDMDVHIGGKKTHERYLMMGQRVELPARQLNTEDPMGEGNDQGKYHQGYINGTRSLEWNNSDAPAVAIAQNASSREPSSSDDECAGVVPEIIITDVKDETMTNCES